jgi:hypothetical protein
MKNKRIITILTSCIILLSAIAAGTGIWSSGGRSSYEYTSIRGEKVVIYGKGLYRHMSAEVAPQGIAQDYVTLFLAIPLLVVSIFYARRNSLGGRLLLAGVVGYFLVTYLFYLVMGMYNYMFLVYVALLGLSFFSFLLIMFSLLHEDIPAAFKLATPVKFIGGFLVFNAICIALLWLGIVLPPLLDGSIIPIEVAHYTTLIVQGLDLGLLLPAAFISGRLLMKKAAAGFLYAPVYFVFLTLLMGALTAKVVTMGMLGYNTMPAVFIIPVFFLASMACTTLLFVNIKVKPSS